MTRLDPVHPGEVLKHDFMDPLGLSATALAAARGGAGAPENAWTVACPDHDGVSDPKKLCNNVAFLWITIYARTA